MINYYSKYSFRQSDSSVTSYLLVDFCAKSIEGMKLLKYKDGREYIRISVPRNANIRKYFAYTLELADRQVLSSVEGLDQNCRTFGDAKSIKEDAILLLQFSNDMKELDLYFVHSKNVSKMTKKMLFEQWQRGDNLEEE